MTPSPPSDSKGKGRILIVDDTKTNLRYLSLVLSAHGYDTQIAMEGSTALQLARTALPDLILLDVNLPILSGFEVCTALKADPLTQGVPVIFISALDEVLDKVQAFEVGGVDYITKPFQTGEVLARVDHHVTIQQLQRQLQAQNARLQQEMQDRQRVLQERQQVEVALQTSEEKFTKVFRASPSPIAITTLVDGRFIEVNESFLDLTGYGLPDLIHRTVQDLELWVDPDRHAQMIRQVHAHGAVRDQELELRTRSAQIRSLLVSIEPIQFGQIPAALYVASDFTERKRLEQSLRDREQRLRQQNLALVNLAKKTTSREKDLSLALQQITETAAHTLGTDRASIWLYTTSGTTLQCVDLFERSTASHTQGQELAADRYPHYFQALQTDRLIATHTAQQDPRTQELRADYLDPLGISALMDASIQLSGKWVGVICLERTQQAHPWTMEDQNFVSSVADLVSLTLESYERQRAEAALQLAEERYRRIFESAVEGIYLISTEGYYFNLNPALAHICGYHSPDEMLQQLRDPRYHLYVDLKRRAQFLAAVAKQGMVQGFESQIRRQDGSIIWISESAHVITEVEGRATLCQGMIQDITERKQIEEALRASEAQYRHLVQTANSIILRWDVGARIRFLNEFGQRFFGFQESEILGRSLLGTIVPDSEATRYSLQTMIADIPHHPDAYLTTEDECTLRTGERVWIRWSNKPLLDRKGRLKEILAIGTDATQRRQTEEQLHRAKEAAEIASQAKSQFLANVSHELRTPLNIILGFTQLLSKDLAVNPEQREQINIIHRSGEQLLGLITDILELSTIEAGQIPLRPSQFDLYHLLATSEHMLQLKASAKGLKLKVERSERVPRWVEADQSKLQQILLTFVEQIILFTQVGQVSLSIDGGEIQPRPERIGVDHSHPSLDPKSQLLRVEIWSSDLKVSEAELERMFDGFVLSELGRQARLGSGLGISISGQYIALMGGRAQVVQSGSQRGLGFEIRVGVVEGHQEEPELPRWVIGLEPNQPAYRILVVDDLWENRQLVVKVLAPLGFEVREAANGQQAIGLWESWRPHLIWMDMRMPGMDGYEATWQIKARSQIPMEEEEIKPVVIAITASVTEEERLAMVGVGCDDMVAKPFADQVLLDKVAKHLGVRYVYQESRVAVAHPLGERARSRSTAPSGSEYALLSYSTDAEDHPLPDLSMLPQEWVAELRRLAIRAQGKQILAWLEQLPEAEQEVARSLSDLVHAFHFETLIDLTQSD